MCVTEMQKTRGQDRNTGFIRSEGVACEVESSKPVKGVGIVIPAFIPPIIAAITALLFAGRENAPAVAYISGVMGTLIDADLLRLHQIKRFGLSFLILSVGGAGVFDGIFIVGIIAVLLA